MTTSIYYYDFYNPESLFQVIAIQPVAYMNDYELDCLLQAKILNVRSYMGASRVLSHRSDLTLLCTHNKQSNLSTCGTGRIATCHFTDRLKQRIVPSTKAAHMCMARDYTFKNCAGLVATSHSCLLPELLFQNSL